MLTEQKTIDAAIAYAKSIGLSVKVDSLPSVIACKGQREKWYCTAHPVTFLPVVRYVGGSTEWSDERSLKCPEAYAIADEIRVLAENS